MGPFIPLANVVGTQSLPMTQSRMDADATPSPAIQADVAPSSRATLRTQVATDPEVVGEPRLELEEGPGAESRRVNMSTEEFIERRRFRSNQRDAQIQPIPTDAPRRLAARTYGTEA